MCDKWLATFLERPATWNLNDSLVLIIIIITMIIIIIIIMMMMMMMVITIINFIKNIGCNWFDKKCMFTLKHYFVCCVLAKLGANAILGVSLAVCKAGASHKVKICHLLWKPGALLGLTIDGWEMLTLFSWHNIGNCLWSCEEIIINILSCKI